MNSCGNRKIGLCTVALAVAAASTVFAAELQIDSAPSGATVFIDGDYVGVTPLTVAGIEPGTHRLRLVRHGYNTWTGTADVGEGAVAVNATLEAIPEGALTITSQPGDAEVLLDGEPVGRTPLTLDGLEPGTYGVRVRKPNFAPIERFVEVAAGEVAQQHFELTLRTEQFYLAEIERLPHKVSNYSELAHYYLLNRQFEKALDMFSRAIATASSGKADNREVKQLYKDLAKVYHGNYDVGDPERLKAIKARLEDLLEESIENAPEKSPDYKTLVALYAGMVGDERLRALCSRMVEKDATSSIFAEVGEIYLERGKIKRAVGFLERAAELAPDDFNVRYSLGTAYHRRKRHEEALAQYDAALKLKATAMGMANLHHKRSRLYQDMQQFDKAEQALRAAIDAASDKGQAASWKLQLVDRLVEQGKLDEAEEICNDLIANEKNRRLLQRTRRQLDRIRRLRARLKQE